MAGARRSRQATSDWLVEEDVVSTLSILPAALLKCITPEARSMLRCMTNAVEKGVLQELPENANVVRLPYQPAAAAGSNDPAPAPRVSFSAEAITYLRTLNLGFAAKTFFGSLGLEQDAQPVA